MKSDNFLWKFDYDFFFVGKTTKDNGVNYFKYFVFITIGK